MILHLLILCLNFFTFSCTEYTIFREMHLETERFYQLDIMSLQLCIRECEKRSACSSINFSREFLQCNLSSSNHLLDGNALITYPGGVYVYVETKTHNCLGCMEHESCFQLSSDNGTCIATECSAIQPNVNNSYYELSFDPPSVKFICEQGYTIVGNTAVSTCVPGQPWSDIVYRCEWPVDGSWSSWGSYGTCSVTCGGGEMSRSRTCTNPAPMYDGAPCSGSSLSSASCNTDNCPIDGSWSSWGSYGSCSVTCGGGTKTRSRSCTNPTPMYNGATCSGSSTSSLSCNTDTCPSCASTSYLVSQGTVTMSTIHQSDGVLDNYWLNAHNSWSSESVTSSEWIQVVFPSTKYVTGIITQGRGNHDQWVTTYYLYYLNSSGSSWILHPTTFSGNSDRSTLATNTLNPILVTTGIRLNPRTWHGHPSLRFDVQGC